MTKEVRVRFINDKLENEYLALSDDDKLKKKINWVIDRIKQNPSFGQRVSKRLIPKEYKKNGVNNIYLVDLSKSKGWRLIYTLTSEDEVEIIAIILDWFTRHKEYGRRFGHE